MEDVDMEEVGPEDVALKEIDMEDLKIKRDLTEDLLSRLVHPDEEVREAAVEALAVSTEDEDWRANELIRQGGIEVVADLLDDPNPHICGSALDIIIAIAATDDQEALIENGVIARLDPMLETDDPVIRNKVVKALWLLVPEVEDVVMTKPQDEY
ncbi:HEAT repeat domain-containing protein [Methanogenium organophilum]|uniref:HEAT repeat domain-containing protein n=1 Tax=Methanogenium organophilum TaxID=2199 RepID=A0A9X9S4Z7_METOG|nr:HEAT repeat domain-containing protein [Methanogenium organophilum]WAI01575.1 HEAT repeat domain-containing protein [Methanogenium organophilum]